MAMPITAMLMLYIRPECREAFIEAVGEVLLQAREEPGCLFLHAQEVVDEPGTFVLLERWRDLEEYRDVVLQQEYFKSYLELSESMYAKPRVVTVLNPVA
ncbi:putative quinol monooxygenase [Actinospica sp.]|uniref:putative quinol monooxygenase n=1 Tax=Actinospica sp. TaxID=1872142 RepID=UPI002C67DAEB|nr:antibiotic biosynthesis monooxygenase [Actinospica sp.]HWG26789.1 antibiotic biosynthesis monooxygenase [Actinospica sp.]